MDARQGVARQDMALGLAPFIKPVIRGKRGWVEGITQQWNGGTLELAGPELDAGDLGVLLALLALALRAVAGDEPHLESGRAAKGILPEPGGKPKPNAAAEKDVLPMQTTLAAICREIGRDPEDGRAHAAIRASIKRLQGVVIEARSGDAWASTHLIAGAAGRGKAAVSITLNYRLTRAVLGTASYGRVRMQVFRDLSPVGQVLYHWLACWRPGYGTCPPIRLDTLARHVWGEDAKGAMVRRRRQQLRDALAELPIDEWSVEIDKQVARIERKNIDSSQEPVFLSTPTRVSEYASPSENEGHMRLPHEMGERLPSA
uniref:Putative Replication protein C n=1 Tax=mine drainage metagenome TaxID=410659 RepID=E6PSI4_9ZZZZ